MPYLEMLNITSDNANNTRATINDTLTITLETNETLAGANITALNGTFQMITENDTVTVNIPVTVNHSTGNVTFNITARDAQNHTLYVTDANLTSGYVFVDTIKPNLTINGNNITIELYSEYIDQGANVTDEDPAYNYTITSNTSAVNSRIPGTYLIEYMVCRILVCNVGSIFNVFTVQLYYYGLIAVDGQIWFYRINKDVS